MDTDEILDALGNPEFDDFDEAVAEAVRRRDEFVPSLIATVEEAVRRPKAGGLGDLPPVGLFLLAQFQDVGAFEPLLRALELDYLLQEYAFGFEVSEYGDRLLASVAGSDPGLLQECALRKSLEADTRWAALQALVLQVAWGQGSAEAVVKFFHRLFETDAFADAPEVWTYLVECCLDLDGALFLEEIRKLYERELVDEDVVGDFKSVEEEASGDREARFAYLRDFSPPITDAAEEWRAIFAEEGEDGEGEEGEEEGELLPVSEPATPFQAGPKVGRNDLCPCGSGKKFKKCCMGPGG